MRYLLGRGRIDLMKLLNLGCGADRPPYCLIGKVIVGVDKNIETPWINIDNHYATFAMDCPNRKQLELESNYINVDLKKGIPFDDNSIDGILASHFLEHLDAQEALSLLKECHRVLKSNGIIRVSIPDAVKFYYLIKNDCKDWGEPDTLENFNPPKDFLEVALLFSGHKQVLDIHILYCLFHAAKFSFAQEMPYKYTQLPPLADLDNRPIFSLFMEAKK